MNIVNWYKLKSRISHKYRNRTGSEIAEFSPALIIIFFFFLFPLLNLLYLALAYGAGLYLNYMELREVACTQATTLGLPSTPAGATSFTSASNVLVSQRWNGLLGVIETSPPSPEVAQTASTNSASLIGWSTVRTTVSIKPFYAMPFMSKWPIFSEIPGLGLPITFVYYGTIQQEEQNP